MDTLSAIFGADPLFGLDGGCRAMSAVEIQKMQLGQQRAMQNAWPSHQLSYLSALGQYQPYQRPLDERFADFKVRLAAAVKRHEVRAA